MDRLTKEQRSRNMSLVRGSGTEFEKKIFRELQKAGIYFRKNYAGVIGKPDIAKPQLKKAVFLHSDFWHGWRLPRWEKILPSEFWKEKIKKNRARDKQVMRRLRYAGWEVMTVWEHSFKKNPGLWIRKITNFLRASKK